MPRSPQVRRSGRRRRDQRPLLGQMLAAAALIIALGVGLAALQGRSSSAQTSGPLRAAPNGRPLVLAFADEFDRFRPLSAGGPWRTTFGDGSQGGIDQRTIKSNNEHQVYVDAEMRDDGGARVGVNPFSVSDGVLRITALRAAPNLSARLQDYKFVSGVITTQPSFSQTYGYFEMRARLPRGKAVWPAFWLLPTDMSWPPEIDVMESIGDPSKSYVTSHSTTRERQGKELNVTPDRFHTFAVSWDPRELIWYIDGREVERQTTPGDMHKPMYMLANLAIGGNWPGAPDASTPSPAVFEIDYIRAYRFGG